MTTTAATVATSRALVEACTVSAWRPAARAITATSASTPARRWKEEIFEPLRSRAWVSTNPRSAQTTVSPNATESTGAIPPGTAIRSPITTPATVSPRIRTWSSRNEPKAVEDPPGAATRAASLSASFTSPLTVTRSAPLSGLDSEWHVRVLCDPAVARCARSDRLQPPRLHHVSRG